MTMNEAIKFLMEENIKAEKKLIEIQQKKKQAKEDQSNVNNSDGF